MAKMKTLNFSKKFLDLQYSDCKNELNETRDCAVKAVALVCEVDYATAHAALAKYGRVNKRGTCFYDTTTPAINFLGKRIIEVDPRTMINQYPDQPRYRNKKSITTRHPVRFPKVWSNGKTYLFRSNRHITAVINGDVHDWAINRALRVIAMYEVVNI